MSTQPPTSKDQTSSSAIPGSSDCCGATTSASSRTKTFERYSSLSNELKIMILEEAIKPSNKSGKADKEAAETRRALLAVNSLSREVVQGSSPDVFVSKDGYYYRGGRSESFSLPKKSLRSVEIHLIDGALDRFTEEFASSVKAALQETVDSQPPSTAVPNPKSTEGIRLILHNNFIFSIPTVNTSLSHNQIGDTIYAMKPGHLEIHCAATELPAYGTTLRSLKSRFHGTRPLKPPFKTIQLSWDEKSTPDNRILASTETAVLKIPCTEIGAKQALEVIRHHWHGVGEFEVVYMQSVEKKVEDAISKKLAKGWIDIRNGLEERLKNKLGKLTIHSNSIPGASSTAESW